MKTQTLKLNVTRIYRLKLLSFIFSKIWKFRNFLPLKRLTQKYLSNRYYRTHKLIQYHGNAEISIINLRDQTSNEKNNYRSNVLNNVKNITIIYRSNFESNSKKNDHQLMYLQLKKY